MGSFLSEIIHVFYFLVNTANEDFEFQIKFFKHESKDDIIEPDEKVHVNTETAKYNVLDI